MIKSLSAENQVLSSQIDGLQYRESGFGAALEAEKKIINSFVSQQIHKDQYSCKKLSEEIHQQQRKVLNQCVHVPTAE